MPFPPQSFFQINSIQTKVLYDLVQRKMALTGTETILDLYCGAGTIGLYLAQNARKVIGGVEAVAAAVWDARRNAELNGIDNARFIHGRAEDEVPKLISRYQVDAVVVDPPLVKAAMGGLYCRHYWPPGSPKSSMYPATPPPH